MADQEIGVAEEHDVPISAQALTVSNASVRLDPPALATRAVLQVQAQPIRLTLEGTIPAPTVGYSFTSGEVFALEGRDSILGALLIREGGTDATVYVTYFMQRPEREE